MPSVPVMTSISPSRPASATAPRPPGPSAPERVRLVDEHAHVVAAGERDDLLQRRDVAVHPEHPVGGDQRRAAVALAQRPREVVGVRVPVGDHVGAGQPAAVDDRAVRELVVQHDLAAPRERRDHPEIGHRARAEQQRRALPGERREPLLEPPVQRHRPARDPRRAGARRPSASPRRPPPGGPSDDPRARARCPSTATAPAARRAPRAAPAVRRPSACAGAARAG